MTDDLRLPERREMPRARQEQRRAHLVRELRAESRRRRLRRPLIIVPAVLALVASGAFAATRIFDEPANGDFVVVDCYERASLHAPSHNAVADLIAPPGQQPGDRTPAEMCAELWDTGELGEGRVVPRLASCLEHREVAVFPGGPRPAGPSASASFPPTTRPEPRDSRTSSSAGPTCSRSARAPRSWSRGSRPSTPSSVMTRLATLSAEPLPGRDCVGGGRVRSP